METISVSKFKATCLSVLKRVQRTRKPVLVTKFGEPLAQVGPPPPKPRPKRWLGDLAHEGRITGDIISPASDESDWEVLRK
jgi:prevent-host-death family protein